MKNKKFNVYVKQLRKISEEMEIDIKANRSKKIRNTTVKHELEELLEATNNIRYAAIILIKL